MEVFALHVDQSRESVADFNRRVADYCKANAVVGVYPNEAGPQLLLSLVPAENVEAPAGTPCLLPLVFLIENLADLEIEEKLNEFVREVMNTPFDADGGADDLYPHGSITVKAGPDKTWYVVLVQYASVAVDMGDDDDG